jgi:hypothetical protein
MIKIRTFLILAVATVVVVVAAIVFSSMNAPAKMAQGERDYAFPKLVERINDAASIEIRSHDHTFTVTGSGENWGIVEKNNYRVPRQTVRNFLVEIANLRLVEGRTERDDRYARLNVDDPKADKSEARGIKVTLKDGTVLADGIIGRRKYFLYVDGRGGTYIRRTGEKRSWLAEGEVGFGKSPAEWLDRLVFEIPTAEVKRYTITHPDGSTLIGDKAERGGKVEIRGGIPADRKFRTDTEADRVNLVVEKFEFEDVFPKGHVDFAGFTGQRNTAEFVTFDGLAITFETLTFPKPEGASEYDEPPRFGRVRASVAADAPADKREEVAKRAAELNAKMEPWEYKLEWLDGSRTTKKLEEMLEPKEQS